MPSNEFYSFLSHLCGHTKQYLSNTITHSFRKKINVVRHLGLTCCWNHLMQNKALKEKNWPPFLLVWNSEILNKIEYSVPLFDSLFFWCRNSRIVFLHEAFYCPMMKLLTLKTFIAHNEIHGKSYIFETVNLSWNSNTIYWTQGQTPRTCWTHVMMKAFIQLYKCAFIGPLCVVPKAMACHLPGQNVFQQPPWF